TLDATITPNTGPTNGLAILGVFPTVTPSLTTGQSAALQLDVSGRANVDLQSLAGTQLGAPSSYGTSPGAVEVQGVNAFITNIPAVTQSGGPWTINETQLNSVALGSPSNYGTSPGAVSVQGVNAFITNTPAVTLASTTITGTVAVTQSTSPWVVSLTSTTITGTVAVTQSGTWTVQQGGAPWSQVGTLTHNNAAPAANNVGALVAVASTAAPTYTTGDQVLLSTDLSGNLRVTFAAASEQNVNLNQWAGTTLGTPANYGTSPGAVVAGSVNAFVTNTV